MELEEVEAAQHLAAADVNTLTTEFMARLAKAKVPEEMLSEGLTREVRESFEEEYEQIKTRNRCGRTSAASQRN